MDQPVADGKVDPDDRSGAGGPQTDTTARTICNRDCPDACGILATVRDGRVVKLAGDPEHPVTRGFLCWRTNHFLDLQYGPDRLTTPLRRGTDGVHRPVSWDEALDFVAERLLAIRAESGPAAIFHYRSGGSLGLTKVLVDWFFELFGPVTVKRGDICSGAGEAAQEADFGVCDSSELSDLTNARHILLWGKNVHVSSPHTIPVLRDAQARGARLVMIDPVHHKGADLGERFWQPRPGGDFALAMAVARLLFEGGAPGARAAAQCRAETCRRSARSPSLTPCPAGARAPMCPSRPPAIWRRAWPTDRRRSWSVGGWAAAPTAAPSCAPWTRSAPSAAT